MFTHSVDGWPPPPPSPLTSGGWKWRAGDSLNFPASHQGLRGILLRRSRGNFPKRSPPRLPTGGLRGLDMSKHNAIPVCFSRCRLLLPAMTQNPNNNLRANRSPHFLKWGLRLAMNLLSALSDDTPAFFNVRPHTQKYATKMMQWLKGLQQHNACPSIHKHVAEPPPPLEPSSGKEPILSVHVIPRVRMIGKPCFTTLLQ